MTRYVIDAPAAIELVRRGYRGDDGHQLVAPSGLRSQALSILYASVRHGEVDAVEARELLDGITALKVRVLGDRVSRATAWRVAESLDLDDTQLAEYLAVCQLQADALIALAPDLRRLAEAVVPLAEIDDLAV